MRYVDWLGLSFRSSRPEVFCKKVVLRNFAKFTGIHLCQSRFFNKVAGLTPAALLKRRLWHSCFSVNFLKVLRTPFLWNTSSSCFCYIFRESGEIFNVSPQSPFLHEKWEHSNKHYDLMLWTSRIFLSFILVIYGFTYS